MRAAEKQRHVLKLRYVGICQHRNDGRVEQQRHAKLDCYRVVSLSHRMEAFEISHGVRSKQQDLVDDKHND